jgi:ribonucleoside-diphosphate reductase alpha chain
MPEKKLKIYSKEEIEKATLEYFKGDELATDVWIKKYCLKDEKNYYELSPDDMHHRIAKELARIEAKYPNPLIEEQIYETLKEFKRIVPQGSPMSGIGNNFQVVSLSNCFVIGNDNDSDSYGGIFKLDQELVQLEKRRGGVGMDLSFIRPTGSPVKNSAITSTGVVPFMERYSNSTKEVAQDGRRGALMQSISIKHPDAENFIDAKLIQGKVTGANISIKLTDEFMNAAVQGMTYIQQFPIIGEAKYIKEIDAQKLWKKIIHNAWKSAEPGVLFWDKIIEESIPDCYVDEGFKTTSTNPCGEIPLCPNDSCRLLAINLFGYVKNPFMKNAVFNWQLFKSDVQIAMRYMDDIIDLELEKIDAILAKIKSDPEDDFIKLYETNLWKKIKEMTTKGRRTGLGITGEGDMLAALGFRYGTDEATDLSKEVHKTLKLNAYRSSVIMAKERGAFPIYNAVKETQNPFIDRINQEDSELYLDMIRYGRRNISLLTIAPTGTLSLMTQTTSGIECCFLVKYKRRRKINPQEKNVRIDFVDDEGIAWMEYPVFHHKFKMWLEINGYDVDVIKAMDDKQFNEIVKKSPYYQATSNDVNWIKKVEMQGKIQRCVDHSISVSINLPKDVDEELVAKVYETAWRSGCKGATIYRDGSRNGILIRDEEKKDIEFRENHAPLRPKRLNAEIHRFQNNLEKWIAVVGVKDGRPYEIFTGKLENGLSYLPSNIKDCEVVKQIFEIEELDENKKPVKVKKKRYDIEYVDSNGDRQVHTGLNQAFNPEFWNYAKLISGIMRYGMPILKQYELIESLNFKEDNINTWKNGVARVIKKYIRDGEKLKGNCPECGSTDFIFADGCIHCAQCSWSKCS